MFGMMVSLLKSKIGIGILAGLILLIALIFVLKILFSRKAVKKEMHRAATDRVRDENLNNVILNPHQLSDVKKAYVPYEVDYSSGNQKNNQQTKHNKNTTNDVMLQITEKTGLSSRKFVLNASSGIRIGTGSDCHITFMDEANNNYLCEIVAASHKEVYIRNAGNTRIILRRKKEQVIIDGNGIKVRSGDTIMIGNILYTINIIK